jgi:hypothetical protein
MVRQAISVPVSAGIFTAMIEKALVIVLCFQWLYLGLYESVNLCQKGGNIVGDVEIH